MTTTLKQVAEALRDRLRTIPGIEGYEFSPGNSQYPVAFVGPPTIEYERLDLTGIDGVFPLYVFVSSADDLRQIDLFDYMRTDGAKSVPAVIQSDPNLGFTDVHAFVANARPLGLDEIAGYGAYGVVFDVPVRIG